jgi:hypothetical protein
VGSGGESWVFILAGKCMVKTWGSGRLGLNVASATSQLYDHDQIAIL